MAALKSLPGTANELIFGAEAQTKDQDKSDAPRDEAEKEIVPKEFFWDQLILYIATLIALLTLLDISLQFLRSGGLFCYVDIPSTPEVNVSEVTRDQAAYINNYCLQDLSISEYYTAFILIQGILLAAPHYLWSSLFRGQFDFFFDLVRQLDRLRDSNTGEYKPANFEIVKKLEKEFPARWKWFRIFSLYIGKLILQLVLAVVFIIVNSVVFPESAFEFVFECPENFNSTSRPDGWLLPFPVHCVYTSFRVYAKLLFTDYFLLVAAIAVTAYGLFWCVRRHTNALGYKDAALFTFTSCLKANEYVYEPFWNRGCRALFSPRIENDLDFILMRLYRADSGHGQVFKEIQVDKELKQYISRDHELLHLYIDSSKDQEITERLQSNCKFAEPVFYYNHYRMCSCSIVLCITFSPLCCSVLQPMPELRATKVLPLTMKVTLAPQPHSGPPCRVWIRNAWASKPKGTKTPAQIPRCKLVPHSEAAHQLEIETCGRRSMKRVSIRTPSKTLSTF